MKCKEITTKRQWRLSASKRRSLGGMEFNEILTVEKGLPVHVVMNWKKIREGLP